MVGLGKLGLAWALLCRQAGHQVLGFDIRADAVRARMFTGSDEGEQGMAELLKTVGLIEIVDPARLAAQSDVIYICVQTPHERGYGGELPMPAEPRDFSYEYLIQAMSDVAERIAEQADFTGPVTLVIMSTVLPGTIDREIRPLLGSVADRVRLVYAPAFISLGTIIQDFRKPKLSLFGADDPDHAAPARKIARSVSAFGIINSVTVSIATAELAKMAVNCWRSMQIVYANALAELAEAVHADVDDVTTALRIADIGPAKAGLGDGGACRPRDAIAMTWFSRHMEEGHNPFLFLTEARESQAASLGDWILRTSQHLRLPIVLLGWAYKPGVPYTYGSPAALLGSGIAVSFSSTRIYDPHVTWGEQDLVLSSVPEYPALFVIATDHPEFAMLELPAGSTVIDPWGNRKPQQGVDLIRIGRPS